MIELKNDILSISVHPENPIYNALKKFSGETFVVYTNETPEITEIVETKAVEKAEKVDVDRERVWSAFYDDFEAFLDPPTLTGGIIKSHLMGVLDGEIGMTKLEKAENGLLKRNDLYLMIRE